MERQTRLISAFPGCGKSHLFRNNETKTILDSDSSKFNKDHFPGNYMEHIKTNMGKADIICISSHDTVRDALNENKLPFTLVYPDRSLKEEYIQRYKDRGNEEGFVKLLEANWDDWMDGLENQKGCDHIKIQTGQYLSDVIE